MNIVWICCVCLCFGFFQNSVNPTDWVDSLTEYIINDSGTRQVALITNLAKNKIISSSRLNNIFSKLMENIPTVLINIGNLEESKNQTAYGIFDDLTLIDNSPPFVIFLHESRDTLPILPSKKLIDLAVKISAFTVKPKYLLIFFTRESSDNLQQLLEYAWTEKNLDFTIVESTEPEIVKGLMIINESLERTIIHRLDPFKMIYTKIKWTSDIIWFPRRDHNIWNNSLRVAVPNTPPFVCSRLNEYQKPVNVSGPNVFLIQIIAQKLNLSLEYFTVQFWSPEASADPKRYIDDFIETRKIDIDCSIIPLGPYESGAVSTGTTTIMMEKLCPIVPILPRVMMPLSINFFIAYLLFFGIVVIIWIFGHVFNFENRLWKPFFIARVLFGISVTRQPTINTERIIFTSLLVVSAIYSSTIYSAITDISLQTNAEMEFDTFEDLDNSGLIPVVNPFLFNMIFSNANGALMNLRKKSIQSHPSENILNCALFAAVNKNITCIMPRKIAEVAVQLNQRDGRDTIKIAKPCFEPRNWGFLIRTNSPYRQSINEMIHRMQNAGLVQKVYKDEITSSTSSLNDDEEASEPGSKQNMIALRQQLLMILITGYSLSFFVFIAEIIVHRITRYRKSKIGTVE